MSLYFAIVLFILAAIFGFVLLLAVLGDRPTPKPVVFTHGIIALIALLAVIYFFLQNNGSGPVLSLVLFIIAALGGLTMFTIDMKNKPIPKWIAVIHPIIAAVGLIALIIYVLR